MREIKFGVMTYSKNFYGCVNIGDYIQSIAASTFFERVDCCLEREGLSDSIMQDTIKIIFNGWFMHSPDNWPPADNLVPLFISFHITGANFADIKMLSPAGITYLKKHEPIGCRDYGTVRLLQKYGINAYFSGCLTLTLGRKYRTADRTENIYFVDELLMFGKKNILKYLLRNIPVIIKNILLILRVYQKKKKSHRKILRAMAESMVFYCMYSTIFENDILEKACFVKHVMKRDVLKNDRGCFTYAESLLKNYASAKLVITSRLHCALPCLGMETPVVFINTEGLSGCRFEGLLDLLRVFELKGTAFQTANEVLLKAGKIGFNTRIENKQEYKLIKENLEKECKLFVDN